MVFGGTRNDRPVLVAKIRVTALPALFLPALACLTLHAEAGLPVWAVEIFNEKLSARYELVQKPQPSFYVGDFNGDGKSDVALLIKEKTTAKVGIAIVEGGERKIKIVGAGKSFGNGGDDFSWMDVWSIRHAGKVDRLYVAKSEAASAVIYGMDQGINGSKRVTNTDKPVCKSRQRLKLHWYASGQRGVRAIDLGYWF